MAIKVSFQFTASMITISKISVKQSINTLTIPLVNRSLSEFTSLITRTRILPALCVSKKEKDSVWMWLNRSSRKVASARRPAPSIRRTRTCVQMAAMTESATMPPIIQGSAARVLSWMEPMARLMRNGLPNEHSAAMTMAHSASATRLR